MNVAEVMMEMGMGTIRLSQSSLVGTVDDTNSERNLLHVAFGVGVAVAAFFLIQFLLIGLRATDKDITDIFNIVSGNMTLGDVAPERQFLLESILPNFYGAALQAIGLSAKMSRVVWTVTGLALLYAAFVYGVYRGHLKMATLISILAFTAIFKTILVWYGKSDPFLFALLFMLAILPAERKTLGVLALLAVFCHPFAAVISVFSFTLAQYAFHRRVVVWPMLGAIVGIILHMIAMRLLFEGSQGRAGFVSSSAWLLFINGLPHTVSFFAISVLLPTAILLSLREWPKVNKLSIILMSVAIALPFAVSLYMTYDHSRVFVMLTLPVLILVMKEHEEELVMLWRHRTKLAVLFSGLVMGMPHLDGEGWKSFELNIINALFAGGWT